MQQPLSPPPPNESGSPGRGGCRIGQWHFVPAARCLRSESEERRLTPQQLRLLQAFIAAPEHCLSKEAMVAQVWDGRIVTDDALTRAVAELRKQLDDGSHEYIQTLHGHGYRLGVPLEPLAAAARPRLNWSLVAGAVLLATLVAGWLLKPGATRPPPTALKLRVEPLQGPLPSDRHYLAIAPAGTRLWHQERGGQSTMQLDAGDGSRLLWQADGQISRVRASPLGTRVAMIHHDDQCSLIGIDLAGGDLHRWASCEADALPAIGWRDEQTLLTARVNRSGQLALSTLHWPGAPQVRQLPAGDCIEALQIAQRPERLPLLSCRLERGAAIYRVGEASLEPVLVYRSIRLWVEDPAGRIYLTSAPAWQPGITRFDPASGGFAYARTGWIADLAIDGEQLLAVRDRRNLDLLAIDLATLGQSTIENSQRMTQAFTVDPSDGQLWLLDDRAGEMALYAGDQLRLSGAESEVDLSEVRAMAVNQAGGWLLLTTQSADRYQHHWLTLDPIVRLARFDAAAADLRIDGSRAHYLDEQQQPAAFDLTDGRSLAAAPERQISAPNGHCPGSPLSADGWQIEILAEADGALFRERDSASGEIRRRWRDSRISRRCGLIQPRLDLRGGRLIYALERDQDKQLLRITIAPSD